MKRFLFIITALLMCLVFTACNNTDGNNNNTYIPGIGDLSGSGKIEGIMVYKNGAISGGVFQYLLSQSKSTYLYSTTGNFTDDEEIWLADAGEGKTVGEVIFEETVDSALSILYYAQVARDSGLLLTQEEEETVISALDNMVASYGSRAAFNNAMLRFGTGYNALRDFYRMEALAQKGADSVLGENGTDPITNDEIMQYYKQNFITLRHLYFNTAYEDPKTGKKPTEKEIQEKSDRADAILELANEGSVTLEDFAHMNEDNILNNNPDGITIPLGELLNVYASSGDINDNIFYNYSFLFSKIPGFAEAALMHETGVVTRVENQGVGIFLVERCPLDLSMFDDFKDVITQFVMRPERMSQTVQKLRSENAFTIDENALKTYSVQKAPVMVLQGY